jgi:4-methyl-5(b-hydroxyethyl)-thiazole monophosphate biosynthesis
MSKTALVAVAEGTEELEAVTIIDVLRRAGAEVTVAAVGELNITASRGVKLAADCVIGDCKEKTYDLIVLPGGLPGAEHLRDSKTLITMLKKQKQANRLYAAICASPAVALAPHGLLDDKQATGYPGTQDKLPKPLNQRVVVDGNCITSQGPGTALEFAIELVRQLLGEAKAKEVAEPMLFLR